MVSWQCVCWELLPCEELCDWSVVPVPVERVDWRPAPVVDWCWRPGQTADWSVGIEALQPRLCVWNTTSHMYSPKHTLFELPYSTARQHGGNIWWQHKIGSLLLKSDNKSGPRNQEKAPLNVTFNFFLKVHFTFYKGEPSNLGLNNLLYFYLEIYINICVTLGPNAQLTSLIKMTSKWCIKL